MIPDEVNIGLCLARLTPGAEFNVNLNNPRKRVIEWRDRVVAQPSESEILAEWDTYLSEVAAREAQKDAKASAREAATDRLKVFDASKATLEDLRVAVADLIEVTTW